MRRQTQQTHDLQAQEHTLADDRAIGIFLVNVPGRYILQVSIAVGRNFQKGLAGRFETKGVQLLAEALHQGSDLGQLILEVDF